MFDKSENTMPCAFPLESRHELLSGCVTGSAITETRGSEKVTTHAQFSRIGLSLRWYLLKGGWADVLENRQQSLLTPIRSRSTEEKERRSNTTGL